MISRTSDLVSPAHASVDVVVQHHALLDALVVHPRRPEDGDMEQLVG